MQEHSNGLDSGDLHELERHADQGGGYYGKIPEYKPAPVEVKPAAPVIVAPVAAPLHHDPSDRKFKDDPGAAGSITFTRHATQAKELLSTGHFDLAKLHFKEALRLRPDDQELLPGYLETCQKTNDWSESLHTVDHIIELDSSKEKDYTWARGQALYELRKWDKAVPVLKSALGYGKNLGDIHEWLLKIALTEKNTPEALNEYASTLKLKPNDYKMRVDYANLLETQGKHGEALAQYKLAANQQPDGKLLSRIGYMIMSYNKDWNGAIAFYNKAIQNDPANANLYQKNIQYCQQMLERAKAQKTEKSQKGK